MFAGIGCALGALFLIYVVTIMLLRRKPNDGEARFCMIIMAIGAVVLLFVGGYGLDESINPNPHTSQLIHKK